MILKFAVILLILFIFGLAFLQYLGLEGPDSVYQKTQSAISKNPKGYEQIFIYLFDEAKFCKEARCRKSVSDKIHKILQTNTKSQPFYESTYFIRLKDQDKMEKLFLHGEYKEEKIDTAGEKKVARFLKSKSGSYLKGFRIDATYTNMNYLEDFYSEAEIIILFKKENKTLGAMVKAYGD